MKQLNFKSQPNMTKQCQLLRLLLRQDPRDPAGILGNLESVDSTIYKLYLHFKKCKWIKKKKKERAALQRMMMNDAFTLHGEQELGQLQAWKLLPDE